MPPPRITALITILLAQLCLIHFGTPPEYLPPPPNLDQLSRNLAGWTAIREDTVDPTIISELGADVTLSRTYRSPDGLATAQLFIAWFQTQRGGRKQPHSPKVCLPGSGWTPIATELTPIGAFEVNRYLVANRNSRAVVLYWYQTPHRIVASEWAAKFWLIADALRYRRTDVMVVRVIVPASSNLDRASSAATALATATASTLKLPN